MDRHESRAARRPLTSWSAVLVLGTLCAGCGGPGPSRSAEEAAEATLRALGRRDFDGLARMAHPERGVRFSPYAYVRPESDVVLDASELRAGGVARLWGEFDGTGDPIRMTFDEYFDRFVYPVDFAAAERTSWEGRLGVGNSIDNCREVYAAARVVEYHVPGVDPSLGGLDWRSLRLAFESHGDGWYLVAVVHDQWTT